MRKNYFNSLAFKKDYQKKDKGGNRGDDKDDNKFLEVLDCYMIYGGPST